MFPVNRAKSHLADQGVSLATPPPQGSGPNSLVPGQTQLFTEALTGHTVDLTPSTMTWARQVSTTSSTLGTAADTALPQAAGGCEWQAYLRAIATTGFTTWVNEAKVNYSASHNPDQATGICQVSGYNIGILPVIGLPSAQVSIPRPAIDSGTNSPLENDVLENDVLENGEIAPPSPQGIHLFILVEIQLDDEDNPIASQTGQATVLSALRRDQIDPNQLTVIDNNYLVEMTQFNLVPEQIQMYLEGLCKGYESAAHKARTHPAITKPTMPLVMSTDGARTSNTANLTARTRIFPEKSSPSAREVQSRQQPCDWRQLAPIGTTLTAPEITEETVPNPAKSELEASPNKELSRLLKRFRSGDIDLPQAVTGVYADVTITEYKLRLYALGWAVEALLEPELSLFLILGPTQGSYLPMDTQLTVKENNLLLTEQTLRWTSAPTYLYTQVFGTWEEKFTVEIALPYARPLSLPPLTFRLDTP